MVYQENDVELLGRKKSKFLRAVAGFATGGLSEVARNKKLRRAVAGVATGGLSEVARNKKLRRAVAGFATGGLSEVARNKKLQRAVAGFATGGLSEIGRIKRRSSTGGASTSGVSQTVVEQQPIYEESLPETGSAQYTESVPAENSNVEEVIEYVDEAGNPTDSEGNPIEYVQEALSGIDSNKILLYCAAGAAVWFLFFKGKK